MEITLYYLPGSRAQRVRWLLEELELDYKLEIIELFKGEGNTPKYLAVQPLGQVPAIKIDNNIMFESGAIVQWLADNFPDKGFSPALDAPQRQAFNQWMYFAVTNLESPAWEIMLHKNILKENIAVKEIIPFATKSLLKVLAVLEDQLKYNNYIVDNKFSAADIMIAYLLAWFPEHVENFPSLKTYSHKLQQRPAYIRSIQN